MIWSSVTGHFVKHNASTSTVMRRGSEITADDTNKQINKSESSSDHSTDNERETWFEGINKYEEPIPTVVRAVSKKLATPADAAAMFRETAAKVGIFTHNIFYDSSEADRDILTLGEDILFHEPPPIPDDFEINSLNFKDILRPN